MKASDLQKEGSELQHKVRSVSDLIRHINTRESDSETPNYNLFFGAGCSVSSGIRPASQLIEEWVGDLYERFNYKLPLSIEEAVHYFESKQSSWYNKDNAYSSLFEKTYEFASQRRRFVEREVDKALPSIGYAYLTSLTNKKYFNTIFTTNFDDLINEAFYQFSNDRPLLCAHDSSIKSISITSKRPKIIKLHGDYLFDDIKSTLRETESLEQNTKEKLIEFCKEFGLIVVGYAGNDRSIMDVLDFLTKQDNYLKNGVYWCLRKDDNINPTLQNLFWKEKVYPVIIDGYDELFAHIHSKLISTGLDFESNLKNSKLQQIKKKILYEGNPLNTNEYIQRDIKNIKEANSKQEMSDFFSKISSNGDSKGLSASNLRNLLEIEDLLKRSEYDKAYKLAEDFYYQSIDIKDKARYTSMLISISDNNDDQRSCLSWCDKLIELDSNNISYIIKKSRYINNLSKKYSYLFNKSKEFEHRYDLYNESAKAGYSLIKNDPLNTNVDLDKVLSHLTKSLKLNPSLSNLAWLTKLDVLIFLKQKNNTHKNEITRIKDEISNHIKLANSINDKSLVTIQLEIKKAELEEDFEYSKNIITRLYDLYEQEDISNKTYVNESLDDLLVSFINYTKKVDSKNLLTTFYESHLKDENINSNSELLLSKSKYFLVKDKSSKEKSKEYFLLALKCTDIVESLKGAMFINHCHDGEYTEKLLAILEERKSNIFEKYYYECKYELLIIQENYELSLECLEKAFSLGLCIDSYFSDLSYILILTKDFQKLIDLKRINEEKIEKIQCNAFMINYQYAAKQLSSKGYDATCLRNIIANTDDSSLKLGAFAVLGQNKDVKRILTEQIDISYINYYTYRRWPIIANEVLEVIDNIG